MKLHHEWAAQTVEGICTTNSGICHYCRNHLHARCIEECASEGLYRYLELGAPEPWQSPPKLSAMARFLECGHVTRFAWLYLVIHYSSRDASL